MKRFGIAVVAAVVFFVFLIGSASAGCVGVETGTDFGCGDTVTESCKFDENMSCPTGHGLIIGANDITIDGNGYMLDGVSSGACDGLGTQRTGIYNKAHDDVEIKNFEIKNFCNGIYFKYDSEKGDRVERITIDNCDIQHNGGDTGGDNSVHGIKVIGVFNSTIKNCKIHHNTGKGTSCEAGGNGIFLKGISGFGAWNNTITHNEIYDNRKGGFFTKMMCVDTEVSYNRVWENGQGGIILRCKKSETHDIHHNNASCNYGDGIFIGGPDNTLRDNIVNNNIAGFKIGPMDIVGDGDGIDMGRNDGSYNNELYNNTVCGNEGTDIDTYGAGSGTTGDNNTCDTCSNYNDEGEICCTYNCPGEYPAGCVADDGTVFRCGDTVTKSCTFNGNLSCSSGHGLTVGADNITIEANGYILDGVNSACTWENVRCGILNEGYDNIAIKNLEVKNFCFGIRLRGTSSYIKNNTMENCNIHHNGNATSPSATHGIKMEYVFNSTIRNNSIHDTIAHVDPDPGCEDGGNGMFLYKGDYNLITQNKFYNNTKGGLFMKYKPKYNNISFNNLWRNGQGGIILRCKLCDFNLIERNNASDNYGSGIFIGGNNNIVKYNTVCNNKNGGPYYDDFIGGHGRGILLGRSDGSCYNTLISNTICGNDYLDIYVVSGVTGNHGVNNTCDKPDGWDDEGTTGCTYGCGGISGCVTEDGTVYRCGDTVTESCTLNGNMRCTDSTKPGLRVVANGITIDGAGYKITGGKNTDACSSCSQLNPAIHSGIIVRDDHDNVVIKDLEIENFCTGITLGCVMFAENVDNNTVTGCKIHDNGFSTGDSITHGIHMVATNNCTITKNLIYNNNGTGEGCGDGGNGIFMHGHLDLRGDYNNITCNNFYDNRKSGFFMKYKCMHCNISNNTATGNGEGGITLMCKKSNFNLIEHNNVSWNDWDGIFIGGRNNTIRNNIANNNGFAGIKMGRSDGSYNNELYGNTVCGNEVADIRTCGAECYGNHGANNTCDTTSYYNDEGTTGCTYKCPTFALFDTGEGTYPSIFGTHKGTIIPDRDITVNKMYTYPCRGTGGHTEYVRIWNSTLNATASWEGYKGDWHDVSFGETFTLKAYGTYNYTIRTGSYPQIIHVREFKAEMGGNITCTEFIDANEKRYEDRIPAIRLWNGQ
jgi:parallel beta-helix repeat protein